MSPVIAMKTTLLAVAASAFVFAAPSFAQLSTTEAQAKLAQRQQERKAPTTQETFAHQQEVITTLRGEVASLKAEVARLNKQLAEKPTAPVKGAVAKKPLPSPGPTLDEVRKGLTVGKSLDDMKAQYPSMGFLSDNSFGQVYFLATCEEKTTTSQNYSYLSYQRYELTFRNDKLVSWTSEHLRSS